MADSAFVIGRVESLGKRISDLNEWEKSFVSSLSERIGKYGERTMISDKQAAVVESIWDKLSGEKPEKKARKADKADKTNPFPSFQSDELPA